MNFGGGENSLEIEFVRRAAQQQAARRMPKNGCEWVRDGPHEALGLRDFQKCETRVDAGDHKIESLKQVIGVIE